MQAQRIVFAFCLAVVSACAAAPNRLAQPPAPFALTAHEANLEASVRVDITGGHGSGVFISKDGLILTNEHVVRHALGGKSMAAFTRIGGVEKSYKAVIVASDPVRDLALIRIEGMTPGRFAGMADDAETRAGDGIYGIGYPGTSGLTTVWGKVRTTPFFVDMRPAEPADFKDGILADLPTEKGSSGQGIFSAATGKLIAIHKLGVRMADGEKAVFISVREIRRFLASNRVSLP